MAIKMGNRKFAELMSRLYDECANIEIEPRTDYSGRGMYGDTCVGFVTSDPIGLAMALGAILSDWEREYDDDCRDHDFPSWFELKARADSMALSSIIYFPNWQIVD